MINGLNKTPQTIRWVEDIRCSQGFSDYTAMTEFALDFLNWCVTDTYFSSSLLDFQAPSPDLTKELFYSWTEHCVIEDLHPDLFHHRKDEDDSDTERYLADLMTELCRRVCTDQLGLKANKRTQTIDQVFGTQR